MLNLFKKLIPNWIKKIIYQYVLQQIKEKHKIKSSRIPRRAIKEQSLINARLLVNREALLKLLPKQGVIAELGVDEGCFSEMILNTCNPREFHLVDFWGSQRYNQTKRRSVEEKFKTQINSGIVMIDIGLSVDVGEKFEDNYFDWIYIDTDHSYKMTIKELETWRPKMKKKGIIAGHDFVTGYWDGMIKYGVIEAVYEFCSKHNWEILYLTMDYDSHSSFAIRKI
jgi:hypothetical protein